VEEWGTRQRDLMERLPSTLTLSLGCMVPATWADIWIASAACPYHNDYRRSSCARSKCFMQPKHRPSVDTVDAILHTQRFDGLLLHGDKKRSHHHKHTIYPRHHEVFRDMTPQKTSHSNTAKTMACCPITKGHAQFIDEPAGTTSQGACTCFASLGLKHPQKCNDSSSCDACAYRSAGCAFACRRNLPDLLN